MWRHNISSDRLKSYRSVTPTYVLDTPPPSNTVKKCIPQLPSPSTAAGGTTAMMNDASFPVAEKSVGCRPSYEAALRSDDDEKSALTSGPLPEVGISELVLGSRLGSGGFSVVHEILDITLRMRNHQIFTDEMNTVRVQLALSCLEKRTSISSTESPTGPPLYKPKYVIKKLRRDLPPDESVKGIADLATEAQFLRRLRHANIIALCATSDNDPLDRNGRYFIVLERINVTLDKELLSWRKEVGKAFGSCLFCICCRHSARLHALWTERFRVARDIACAIQYLHDFRIVYRDLKPENVGFNDFGVVKLFDFGLAKVLPNHATHQITGLYRLTGNTGSLRYMAPEVALGLPYDERVDSYSFGILLWQICALSVPYAGFSCKMHAQLVVGKGFRPKVYSRWPGNWGQFMRECWSGDLYVRPNFDRIVSFLIEELELLDEIDYSKVKPRKQKYIRKEEISRELDVDMRFAHKVDTSYDVEQPPSDPDLKII